MPDALAGRWITTFASGRLAFPSELTAAPMARRMRGGMTRAARGMRPGKTVATPRQHPELHRSRRPGQASGAPKPVADPVLSQGIFRSALSRERKRADRLNEGFALLKVRCDPDLIEPLLQATAVATPEHSIVGWMTEERELGIIVTDLPHGSDDAAVRRIERVLGAETARRAGPEAVRSLRFEAYTHAGPVAELAPGLADLDPLLDDLRSVDSRRPIYLAAKRLVDVVSSLTLLLLCAPVFLVVVALIKLGSPGPAFFRQRRVGLLARPFTMLKFRTMAANNDPALHKQFVSAYITASGTHVAAPKGDAPFKIKADPRVTRLGRVLRRTSLDELPQLWNVLRGDMSLVGPRPPIDYELARYQPWHWRRVLEAKPGMTGLWQVVGRSRTTFDEMVRLDVAYARNRSLLMDLRILLATPRAMFTGKGAY